MMKKISGVSLFIGFVLMVAGILIFLYAMFNLVFDFKKLATQKYEKSRFEVQDDFYKI